MALALCCALGLILALGFYPASLHFLTVLKETFKWEHSTTLYGEIICFPVLALLFHLSIKQKHPAPPTYRLPHLWLSVCLPLLISALYGWIQPDQPLFTEWKHLGGRRNMLWFLLCAPVGEELLFRGWLYKVLERIWPGQRFTLTNPLPLSVWGSSLAFSLWHLQNVGTMEWGFIGIQLAYTLVSGLWLGLLRWQSGSLFGPICVHIGLNLACNIV